ncbi:MAG TPA: energy transducer TonB [Verrucomicrobiae bacterium]|nr:energy transducer TonB [Verrucomicrobiae bacterium]
MRDIATSLQDRKHSKLASKLLNRTISLANHLKTIRFHIALLAMRQTCPAWSISGRDALHNPLSTLSLEDLQFQRAGQRTGTKRAPLWSTEGISVYRFTGHQVQHRIRAFSLPLLAAALMLGSWPSLRAQITDGEAPRHIKMAVKPEYSLLAKRLSLSGIVKVEVVVAPDGKVKRTRVVGGHPVLGIEAEKAARATIFEAAPKETTQIIEFRFSS